MKKTLIALFACVSTLTTSAHAERIWEGWMNLPECTRLEWTNNGIFGTPSPTYRHAPQELHGSLDADVPSGADILRAINICAQNAVAAAGLVAVLTNWAGAYPTFQSSFSSCISSIPRQIAVNNLRFSTYGICRW